MALDGLGTGPKSTNDSQFSSLNEKPLFAVRHREFQAPLILPECACRQHIYAGQASTQPPRYRAEDLHYRAAGGDVRTRGAIVVLLRVTRRTQPCISHAPQRVASPPASVQATLPLAATGGIRVRREDTESGNTGRLVNTAIELNIPDWVGAAFNAYLPNQEQPPA